MGSAGTPVASPSRATASRRAPRAIAPPIRMTGRRAAPSSASACSTSAAAAAPGGSRRGARAPSPAATFASSKSPGRLTCTGPGRPLLARSSAVAMSSPSRAASFAIHEALQTGAATAAWSISWKAPRPSCAVGACPLSSTTGDSDISAP